MTNKNGFFTVEVYSVYGNEKVEKFVISNQQNADSVMEAKINLFISKRTPFIAEMKYQAAPFVKPVMVKLILSA